MGGVSLTFSNASFSQNFFTPAHDQETWNKNNFSTEVFVQILIEICTLDADTEPFCVTIACDDIQTHAHKIISKLICTLQEIKYYTLKPFEKWSKI